MTGSGGKGIIDTPSSHSVDQTVERLKGILQAERKSRLLLSYTQNHYFRGFYEGSSSLPWL
jgi:hypothetical protein